MKLIAVNMFDGSTEELKGYEVIESIGKERFDELVLNGIPQMSPSGQELYICLL